MKFGLTLATCVFLLFSLSVFAQKDTLLIDSVRADSSMRSATEFQALIKQSNEQKLIDSLHKSELENQISLLRESNSLRKTKLEQELKILADKNSLRKIRDEHKIDSLKRAAIGYPVAPFSDTLITIFIKSGSSRPIERAATITRRIKELYEDDFLNLDSISIDESEYTVDIVYGDVIIASISDMDAEWEGRPKQEIAKDYLVRIKEELVKEKAENALSKLLLRIGLVLLIAFFIALLIWAIGKLHQYFARLIIAQRDKRFKDVTIKDYTLFSSKQGLKLALSALRFFKLFLIFVLLFLTLPLIFSVFPFTQSWAGKLISMIWLPFKGLFVAIWKYLPNLITILVIYIVMKYFIRLVKYIFSEIDNEKLEINGFHKDWAMPTFSIVKFLLYAFMLVLIFPYLPGSESNIFKGVSVFIGILFSLGSSSAIANMVAGLVITYMRPFKVGDKIKIGNVAGAVIEKTLLVTRLRTLLNEEVTIPNSAILSGNTINYSTFSNLGLVLHVSVSIGYDVPWKKVHDALLEAASKIDIILKDPPPFVLQTSLDDFYVSYMLNVHTSQPGLVDDIKSLMNQHIQDVFAEKGIEIMSPHYLINRDGNQSSLPEA